MQRYDTLVSVSDVMNQQIDKWTFIDCRFELSEPDAGTKQYLEGHIPGARYAHLDKDLSGQIRSGTTGRHPLPDPVEFLDKVRAWGILQEQQVVCYDQWKGAFAARLWWMMRWLGHQNVAVLDGGWKGWTEAGGYKSSDQPLVTRSNYQMEIRSDFIMTADEILEQFESETLSLVDARLPNRYLGIDEPIDPVAGHIRGALNHPYVLNIDADGNWKDREKLKPQFGASLGLPLKKLPVFYCGSGVTACHNILAFKEAGLGDAKLYPGSWSEWITDPHRLTKTETN
ncbi:MAG: sulfurtransferase [Saprospiraceae bacterium]|nr:sulfurtransferase [Saprospiraceae bacterium]